MSLYVKRSYKKCHFVPTTTDKSVKSWSCLLLFSVDPDRISFMVFLTHHSDSRITFLTSNLCLLEASHFLLFPQENSQLSGRFPVWENLQSVLELQS